MAVIRTRLFWTGPFGFGGAIGTGTGTTAWLGGVDRDMPGCSAGTCGSTGGGAGVSSWARTKGANSKASVTDDKNAFHGQKGSKLKQP